MATESKTGDAGTAVYKDAEGIALESVPANGKTALMTGITGQDGSYLAELLLSKVGRGEARNHRLGIPVGKRWFTVVGGFIDRGMSCTASSGGRRRSTPAASSICTKTAIQIPSVSAVTRM